MKLQEICQKMHFNNLKEPGTSMQCIKTIIAITGDVVYKKGMIYESAGADIPSFISFFKKDLLCAYNALEGKRIVSPSYFKRL